MLAAEPVFHKQTPGGVETVAVPFGHALSNLPELLKNFTENAPAQRPVQVEASLGIMINLTRGEPTEDAPALMVELVSGQFELHGHRHVPHQRPLVLLIQRVLQVLHPSFRRAIVAGITGRTVERQHQVALQDGIDGQAVER